MKKLFVVWFMLAATGIFPTITFRRDTVLPAQRYGHCNFTTGEILNAFEVMLLQAGQPKLAVTANGQ